MPRKVINQLKITLLTSLLVLARGDFIVTVNFINYTNPTGLCAECLTRLGVNDINLATQLLPECCDERVAFDNCDNTGDERCDTRFRWTLRPFGSSLETRPESTVNASLPSYLFTDCNLNTSLCPFSEMNITFGRGEFGFLGVAQNPLPVPSRSLSQWTGRVQFFIESVHSVLPNVIDSFLINLDNLQLGADFTNEITYTGFSNIAQMTMSFRVECAPGFCGSDCTLTNLPTQIMANCLPNGRITCLDGWDPFTLCTACTSARRVNGNCSQCVFNNTDPDNDCHCLEGFTGDDCSDVDQLNQVSLVGGVVGGVAGLIVLIIIVLVTAIVVVIITKQKSESSDEREEHIEMKGNPVYGTEAQDKADSIKMTPNTLYGQTINTSSDGLEQPPGEISVYEYVN